MLQFKAGDEILHKVPEEGDGKVAAPPMPKVEAQPQDEEKLMNQRLNWAKELFKEGKTDAAKQRLKDIVSKSPDSAAGKEAKELLSKIQ
jgi:Tfp pilus assembly protein PilF